MVGVDAGSTGFGDAAAVGDAVATIVGMAAVSVAVGSAGAGVVVTIAVGMTEVGVKDDITVGVMAGGTVFVDDGTGLAAGVIVEFSELPTKTVV